MGKVLDEEAICAFTVPFEFWEDDRARARSMIRRHIRKAFGRFLPTDTLAGPLAWVVRRDGMGLAFTALAGPRRNERARWMREQRKRGFYL
jgi:hypothetical protein